MYSCVWWMSILSSTCSFHLPPHMNLVLFKVFVKSLQTLCNYKGRCVNKEEFNSILKCVYNFTKFPLILLGLNLWTISTVLGGGAGSASRLLCWLRTCRVDSVPSAGHIAPLKTKLDAMSLSVSPGCDKCLCGPGRLRLNQTPQLKPICGSSSHQPEGHTHGPRDGGGQGTYSPGSPWLQRQTHRQNKADPFEHGVTWPHVSCDGCSHRSQPLLLWACLSLSVYIYTHVTVYLSIISPSIVVVDFRVLCFSNWIHIIRTKKTIHSRKNIKVTNLIIYQYISLMFK